jgi:hypothetical protein
VYSDRREQLITETVTGGQTPFVVFAKGDDVRLLPLDEPIDRDTLQGLAYCGVAGVVNGRPKVATGPDAGTRELEAVKYAGFALSRQVFGDSISWLDRLFALPDARTEHPC